MRIAFTKMHGAGNDFVVIDARATPVDLTRRQAQHIAHRRFGVGCDQIMVLTEPATPDADFGYRIFNADGGEVEQCGNGARAVALYARRSGSVGRDMAMASPAGRVLAHVKDDLARVDMGPARFAPAEVPLLADAQQNHYTATVDGTEVSFGAVSMGNPHAVITVDSIDDAPVARLGSALQQHERFPEGVNVGFMQILDRTTIALRVNERGVGETLACGTGACAAVAVGVARGDLDPLVQVRLPGGQLMVDCSQIDQAVWLMGTVHIAFEGHIDL